MRATPALVNESVPGHPAAVAAPSGACILLVEDDDEIRTVVSELLAARGYTVELAENGAVALALLQTSGPRFDLVITDLVMPELGGQELAEHIRRSLPDLPILFVSGYSKQTLAEAYQESSTCAFLGKPFAPAALHEKVARLLRTRGPRATGPQVGTLKAALPA